MFEQVGILAEKMAMNVSRRAFLGRLGQGALGLAAVIGGMLSFPGQAQAAAKCCTDPNSYYPSCIKAKGNSCPSGWLPVDCSQFNYCPH